MSFTNPIIVFTDLDGSLLDHHDYSYDAAGSALERLAENDIPLIPVTSKTLSEIKMYSLFENVPKVAENGMVIDIPKGYFKGQEDQYVIPGYDYAAICAEINGLPPHWRKHISGFSDMKLAGVISETGLPEERGEAACDRKASEPFVWRGDDEALAKVKGYLQEKGFKITRGGRFYHLMSQGGKDRAMAILIEKFKRKWGCTKVTSIALGDGANDADMLAAADYGVKIPNESGVSFDIPNPKGKIIYATNPGPKGWGETMHSLLDELGLSR